MSEKKKDAPPDPTKASHYVIQHPTDHHERGKVVEAVDAPPGGNEREAFDRSYATRSVIRREEVGRLLGLNAIRPATEDEVESGFVPMAPGMGGHPAPVGTQHPPAGTEFIDKQELAQLRAAAAAGGDSAEVKKLRARIAELENDKARQMEEATRGRSPGRG